MATSHKLNGTLRDFILGQHLFFVATAGREGRVNVSPKGMDTLQIIDDQRIVWLNLSGSGSETAAHVLETGRMTLMFCAFEGDAMILRTYGTAKIIQPHDTDWDAVLASFPTFAGSRQIFDLSIDLVQTSCGTGVPVMSYQKQRGPEELVPYFNDMGPEGVTAYWRKKNRLSLDGKPTGLLPDDVG